MSHCNELCTITGSNHHQNQHLTIPIVIMTRISTPHITDDAPLVDTFSILIRLSRVPSCDLVLICIVFPGVRGTGLELGTWNSDLHIRFRLSSTLKANDRLCFKDLYCNDKLCFSGILWSGMNCILVNNKY